MTILARIHRYHTESWRRLPPRSVVFVMHVVLLGNALALWIRPEQFEVLIAYQELNDIVAAPVWGAVAFGLSILMLVLPMLCRGVQVTALGAVALFWALVSAAVLYGDGINTFASMHLILSLLAATTFIRFDPDRGDAE